MIYHLVTTDLSENRIIPARNEKVDTRRDDPLGAAALIQYTFCDHNDHYDLHYDVIASWNGNCSTFWR